MVASFKSQLDTGQIKYLLNYGDFMKFICIFSLQTYKLNTHKGFYNDLSSHFYHDSVSYSTEKEFNRT